MRIDALNQISQMYGTNATHGVKHTSRVSDSDKVEISNFGKDLQTAKQAVNAAPDIRKEKVAEYKERIQSGEYEVSADRFAEKMLAKYGEFM